MKKTGIRKVRQVSMQINFYGDAKKTNKMIELIKRWKAKTPQFFSKLRKGAIAVGSSATAVWAANSSMNLELAEPVLEVCKYTIAFCIAVGLTSQLTAEHPEKL